MPSYIPNIPYLSELFPLKHAETAVVTKAKPQMRGLLRSSIRRNLSIGVTLSLMSGFAYKTLVADVRKKKYADFYRNYDAEKVFEDMRKKRLFQSC